MARVKIDYGIDLGTTNSAICRMERGEPTIIKTDVLKDTMPSCVSITKKGSLRAGDSAYNDLKSEKKRATKTWSKDASNAYVEFKRTMATDTKYHSTHAGRAFSSEELSAEVLKTLKSFVTDEHVHNAVITVPAKFTANQKTATMEAAKLAGFRKCELLQEPIAAAMAYGLSANEKDGLWMVFDFGGGTFDAALLRVEDGIMQVFDTEGDNYLGGKNLDYAVVDEILLPYLEENYVISDTLEDAARRDVLRDTLKVYAEEVKNQLSFKDEEDIISNVGDLGSDEDGEDIELDLTVRQEELFDVLRPHFQRAIDMCKALLERNKLSGAQLSKLILVGGPTHCPLVRQMLREQISPNVDTSIDPMTAVAMGAALYASTIDAEVQSEDIERGAVQLQLGYEATSVEQSEWLSVSLKPDAGYQRVWVELSREGGAAWSTGKIEVDTTGNVAELQLVEGRANAFGIRAYDEQGNALPCFPQSISIIQGSKVGAAPLPYNIGIAVYDEYKARGVFRMAKGLEKNKPLPAVGVINSLRTSNDLRPGVAEDSLKIPVYQTDDFAEAEGKTASLYEHIGDVLVSGEDLDQLITRDSLVDLTLKVDSSEQMTLELHFLASDITVDKVLDTSKKHSLADADKEIGRGLRELSDSLERLSAAGIDTDELESELDELKREHEVNTEKKMVLSRVKELMRKTETLDGSTEWERLEHELHHELGRLEEANRELGNEQSTKQVEELKREVDRVVSARNVLLARSVLERIVELFVDLTLVYQCMAVIRNHHERFGAIAWRDRSRARQLIDRGLEAMNGRPERNTMLSIAQGILQLLPDDERSNAEGLLR